MHDSRRGVISARQAADLGVTHDGIRRQLSAGRLVRLHEGIYLTGNMRPGAASRWWAALLASGDGAVLSHWNAAKVYGFTRRRPGAIVHVSIPASRVEVAASGVRVHRSRLLPAKATVHDGLPITTAADTVLGLVAQMRSPHDVVALLTDACRSKAVTAGVILKTVGRRKRQSHRQLIKDVLADVIGGVESLLEHKYLVRVERPHGLPRGRVRARPPSATDMLTSKSRASWLLRWRRSCGTEVGPVN